MRLLRLWGHPLHPTLSHLPIGLWVAGVGTQWVAAASGNAFCWALSFWQLFVGLVATPPIAAVGLFDFSNIPRAHPAKATGVYHLLSMGAATALVSATLWAQRGPNAPDPRDLGWTLALGACSLLVLGLGAWLGEELILRYGVGRIPADSYAGPERRSAPPKVASHG